VTSTYTLNQYFQNPVSATVSINTTDRKTEPIEIAVPAYEVTLLGSDWNDNNPGDGFYTITSNSISEAMLAAFISQDIFPVGSYLKTAFAKEFVNIDYINTASGPDNSFMVVPSAADTTFKAASHTTISGGELLSSSILHTIASGSDCEEEPWTLNFKTYIGQEVKITWPLSVKPNAEYKFNTVGLNIADNSFSIPESLVWQGGTTSITEARTELDLVKNNKIQIMTGTGGSGTIGWNHYDDADKMLVPEFTLVEPSSGISIVDTGGFSSLVKYYGPASSVAVKSALYIMSGNTRFLVPNSDVIYVNNTSNTVQAVNVKQYNPIADPAVTTGSVTLDAGGSAMTIPVTMTDVLGNNLYTNGAVSPVGGNYADTVQNIFGQISFSVSSVDGGAATGWVISPSGNPSSVLLSAGSSVAPGVHTVVVKAYTRWKTYSYTITATVN
jgi:hypothetical protein